MVILTFYGFVNNSQFSDNLQLNLGVDHFQDDVSHSKTSYDVDKRNTTGVFAHTLYTSNSWTYEATLRHDDTSPRNAPSQHAATSRQPSISLAGWHISAGCYFVAICYVPAGCYSPAG